MIDSAISDEVMRWPEFIALAERLGIDLSRPTRFLSITLPYGNAAVVTHEFLGTDKNDAKETSDSNV